MKTIKVVYFSPTGGVEKITKRITEGLEGKKEYHDLMEKRIDKKLAIHDDEALVLAMPVFIGRVPEFCLSSIRHIHGDGRPAVIIGVYGNRDFDDALVEMQDMLTEQGLDVMAAGAFVAKHSLFPEIAAERPDDADDKAADKFAKACNKKLAKFDHKKFTALELPGTRPYRERSSKVMVPTTTRKCTKCRTCVQICPVHAIGNEHPKKIDEKKCIGCAACVAKCPTGARCYSGAGYKLAKSSVSSAAKVRKEPETFI